MTSLLSLMMGWLILASIRRARVINTCNVATEIQFVGKPWFAVKLPTFPTGTTRTAPMKRPMKQGFLCLWCVPDSNPAMSAGIR